MAKILDGKKLSESILNSLKKEIKKRRLKLRLAVVLAGNNPASKIYIRKKAEACRKIGIGFKLYIFRERIGERDLKKEIGKIARDPGISGIIIQLPLPFSDPKKIQDILNTVPPEKDADVLSENNFEKFSKGRLKIMPPTVGAVVALLRKYGISLKGKYVVIVGAGRLVGKPLAIWMALQKANFSILDKNTEDLSCFTKKADILISGVGKPDLIKGEMVREGAVVIDVGISKKNGKTLGDVNFKSVSKKASFITPIIGGVGPMTVACLIENLIKLNR